jgi:hypothetical protein
MAGIGVGLVHLRKCESIARHELLSLETKHVLLRRTAQQQESKLGYLTNPKQIADRARRMNIDPDRRPVRLAGPAERRRLNNTRRTTN